MAATRAAVTVVVRLKKAFKDLAPQPIARGGRELPEAVPLREADGGIVVVADDADDPRRPEMFAAPLQRRFQRLARIERRNGHLNT